MITVVGELHEAHANVAACPADTVAVPTVAPVPSWNVKFIGGGLGSLTHVHVPGENVLAPVLFSITMGMVAMACSS